MIKLTTQILKGRIRGDKIKRILKNAVKDKQSRRWHGQKRGTVIEQESFESEGEERRERMGRSCDIKRTRQRDTFFSQELKATQLYIFYKKCTVTKVMLHKVVTNFASLKFYLWYLF